MKLSFDTRKDKLSTMIDGYSDEMHGWSHMHIACNVNLFYKCITSRWCQVLNFLNLIIDIVTHNFRSKQMSQSWECFERLSAATDSWVPSTTSPECHYHALGS